MSNLDGKDEVKAVPFDAHEQAQQAAADKNPANAKLQEFPKAVDHLEKNDIALHEPVAVQNAKEEKVFSDAKAAAEKQAVKDDTAAEKQAVKDDKAAAKAEAGK
jgi:hypothetical protein